MLTHLSVPGRPLVGQLTVVAGSSPSGRRHKGLKKEKKKKDKQ